MTSPLLREDNWPVIYRSLRKLAQRQMGAERADHTLGATALVHEVYLRLAQPAEGRWVDERHFYRAAAEAMRHLLVDHARARCREKRGGGRARVPLTQVSDVATLSDAAEPDDVIALDAATAKLERLNPEVGEIVRMRFYTGLSVEQTAAVTGSSPRTVKRHWAYARAWLFKELAAGPRTTRT